MDGRNQWDNICSQVNTCALTGAAAFFAGIPDAAIVANGPLWCYFYARRYLEKPCPSVGKRFFGTQPDNQAVVYGTEECLLETLHQVRQTVEPAVLFIENSCAVSLIGDDVAGIAAQADLPYPVMCLDSGGLVGGFWEGYRAAAREYFARMDLQPRREVMPKTVNLLGCTVGYYNGENDLAELKRMLTLAGYRVLAVPGGGSGTAEIKAMTRAEINLVVHEELGGDLARYLKAAYAMPYMSLLPPYGLEDSLNWLKHLGLAMGVNRGDWQAVEKETADMGSQLRLSLREAEQTWGEPRFSRTVVAGPSSVAMGISRALQSEWADSGPVTVVAHDGMLSIPEGTGPDSIVNGQADSREVENCLMNLQDGLLMGSSQEKALLQQWGVSGVVCQNIAFPVHDEVNLTHRPFMGLRGTAHMAEKLWNRYIQVCQQGR